ncbi:unnamed protein product [Rhizophagus irregularis]|nr:unnamed protein product [Rhizophagus irregularis]CAB4435567.1 unnamed protein product [Rhizophagus irregularis]
MKDQTTTIFGFKLLSIEKECKTKPLEINSRIHPFSELSYSTKRRKMLSLSQHILDIVEAEKENKFHPTDQIELNQIKFKTSMVYMRLTLDSWIK